MPRMPPPERPGGPIFPHLRPYGLAARPVEHGSGQGRPLPIRRTARTGTAAGSVRSFGVAG